MGSGRDVGMGSRPQIRPTGGSRGTLGSTTALATRPRAGGNRTPVLAGPFTPSSPPPAAATTLAGCGGCGGSSSSSVANAQNANNNDICSNYEAPSGASSSSSCSTEKCDKCDGKHPTDRCPFFKKDRDKHPDARRASEKKGQLGLASGPPEILKQGSARVVRQPGDGSCLFHSMSHGLRDGTTANSLRRQVVEFIAGHPELEISDSPLKEWILWDSGSSVQAYCRRMGQGGVWGGGIEMAAVSHMKNVNVYVYQQSGGGFKRISCFEGPDGKSGRPVRVLYGGGVHYDALEVTAEAAARR